jgi:hypothetical protein
LVVVVAAGLVVLVTGFLVVVVAAGLVVLVTGFLVVVVAAGLVVVTVGLVVTVGFDVGEEPQAARRVAAVAMTRADLMSRIDGVLS